MDYVEFGLCILTLSVGYVNVPCSTCTNTAFSSEFRGIELRVEKERKNKICWISQLFLKKLSL